MRICEKTWLLSVELTPRVHPVLVSAAPVDETSLTSGRCWPCPAEAAESTTRLCGIRRQCTRSPFRSQCVEIRTIAVSSRFGYILSVRGYSSASGGTPGVAPIRSRERVVSPHRGTKSGGHA